MDLFSASHRPNLATNLHIPTITPNFVIDRTDFTKEFNKQVDDIRKDRRSGGLNADLLNKDKTRVLQFIPPLDVFEKVVSCLLRCSCPGQDVSQMSGESMVRAIASIDHEHFLHSFQPPSICPLAAQQSIDGAVALAAWFRRTQELSFNAPAEIAVFRSARLSLVQPVPTPTVEMAMKLMGECSLHVLDPLSFLKSALRDKNYLLKFAQDPYSTLPEVKTRLLELLLLAFVGFFAISDNGRWGAVHYAADSEDFLKAVERLQVACAARLSSLFRLEGLGRET